MTTNTSATVAPETPRKKPRIALAIASALGVGYIPKSPGTFGSAAGIVVAVLTHPISLITIIGMLFGGISGIGIDVPMFNGRATPVLFLVPSLVALLLVGLIGVWSSSRAAAYAGVEDPQYVVLIPADQASVFALYSAFSLLNWKYLLLGFILFRVFDIWKPWPVRRLEKLPGGWGIMADDWMAGIYAAIVLRVALHLTRL